MPRIHILSAAIALSLMGSMALAAPAGTVLFTQTGSQIVDANGVQRPAQRGDVLQHGERLLTPEGSISQVLMQDGSILGARPGSELRFDPPAAGGAPGAVALLQGSVRVIASELMDSKRPSALTLTSGPATLQLKGADLETTVVGDKQRSNVDPGSYSRLLTGNASVAKGNLVEPLAPRQVSFVSPSAAAPVTISAISPDVFGSRVAAPIAPIEGSKTPIVTVSPTLSSNNLNLATSRLTPITTPLTLPTKTVINPPVPLPPPTKLPVVSCRILKTC